MRESDARAHRVRVVHTLRIHFAEQVLGADLSLRLAPRALDHQRVEHHQIIVEPRPLTSTTTDDEHGNRREDVAIRAPFRSLEVVALSTVAMSDRVVSEEARRVALDLASRAGIHPARPAFPEPRPREGGVCRERTEMAIERLAAAEIAARYVTGYPLLRARGRTLPHAWVSFEVPDHGWLDLDPTSGELAPAHLVLGWGNGYDDVAPIAGSILGSGRFRMSSVVTVEPLEG